MAGGASLTFTEPHEYQERIRPAEVQIIPTERGVFRASLSQMNLDQLTVQHGWQSLPTVTRTTLHPSRSSLMFQTAAPQAAMRIDGVDIGSDAIALGAPGEEHFLQGPSGGSWATLTLTPATYAEAGGVLAGEGFEPDFRTSVIRPAPDAMARLRTLHHRIMTVVPEVLARDANPEVTRAAEQSLLTAVFDCLEREGDAARQPLGTRNGTAVMRRLYELLEASEGLPLYLMDVCTQIGVSRRTFHNACAEHLGLSPHRFLWLRRMQLARQALMAHAPNATVTDIATNLGFWELGRFAGHYKRLFGETPSATLAGRRR